MSDQLYRALARRLDSIPPGFPVSKSGVELGLLARLYTPEEAAIITATRLSYEPAGTIAKSAATDPGAVYDILCAAANKGLVRTRILEGCLVFAPDEGAFNDDELIRSISLEESRRILRQATDEGSVHTSCVSQIGEGKQNGVGAQSVLPPGSHPPV